MREFDDLDVLFHGTLTSDTATPRSAVATRRVLRAVRVPRLRITQRAVAALHLLLDRMLLCGANEPVYPMPLEGAFFKMFRLAC